MNKPIVSICIATYQRYEVLKELLENLLSVNNDDFEVVVCDDHSTDGSYEKIKEIDDKRVRFYSNSLNAGSVENICKTLDHGNGTYLLYLNDRDMIDPLKLPKLLSILHHFEGKNVAFGRCINILHPKSDFTIYSPGKESFIEFACRLHHISGLFFRKDKWEGIKTRVRFFTNQKYGDWPYTYLYALLAVKNSGAYIWNDVCNMDKERIDFSKVKSGFYLKRHDKRVWFRPAVQWRELRSAYKFLAKLPVPEEWVREVICNRYHEALANVMIYYSLYVSLPSNTIHYGLNVSKNKLKNHIQELFNGFYLWNQAHSFWKSDFDIMNRVNKITFDITKEYFANVYKDWLEWIF